MQKYNKYKDSGIEWIGEIPEGWTITKLKFETLPLKSGGTPSASNSSFYSDDGTPWVAISDMSAVNYVNDTQKKVTLAGIADKGLTIYPKGTLLYSIYATIGKVSILNIPATINQAILAISTKNSFHRDYLKFNLISMEKYIFSLSNGNTQFNLNAEKVANFSIVKCSFEEQQSISTYLNSKCNKIDKVIATQQKRVELLRELKQSIITRAVTKGINPNAKLKDSGVEWIGMIPENWEVLPIKYCADTNSGSTPKNIKGKQNEDSTIIWVRTTDLDNDIVTDSSEYLTKEEYESASCPWLNKGTVVVAMYGGAGTIGKCGLLEVEATINQALCSLSCHFNYSSNFMFACIKALRKYWMKFAASSRKDPNISQEIIRNVNIPVPPIGEQEKIVLYIESKCKQLDSSISKALRQIDLLKEYKQSLITEVVTGKRKVV